MVAAMTFKSDAQARVWAQTYARDYSHAYQFWRVVRRGRDYVVAFYSRNTGIFSHIAED
jgi:roadblock/LC7 domain-containing protein